MVAGRQYTHDKEREPAGNSRLGNQKIIRPKEKARPIQNPGFDHPRIFVWGGLFLPDSFHQTNLTAVPYAITSAAPCMIAEDA